MTLKTEYDIGQPVFIIGIDQPGRVTKITLDGLNLLYEVQYWWEGQLRFVTLSPDEIRNAK